MDAEFQRGETETACGARNLNSPFPFPLRGKAGAGGFPPRRKHAARQQKALAHIDAVGSPHKRGCAPLCIPRLHLAIIESRRRTPSRILGTFYFAGNRNFLLCVDKGAASWVVDPVKRTAWEYHSTAEPVRASGTLRAGDLSVSLEELFSALDTAH
jgi:hypothetical protein